MRASERWNAINQSMSLSDVPGGYSCTFSVWVRTSSTLDAGYVAVRDSSDPSDGGETLGFKKLLGERVRQDRTIVANHYENGYEEIAVHFEPPASKRLSFSSVFSAMEMMRGYRSMTQHSDAGACHFDSH